MFRSTFAALIALAVLPAARGHFVFVVPDAEDPTKLVVVLSEDLEPDEAIAGEMMKGMTLTGRYADGKSAPVKFEVAKHTLTADVGRADARCVHGTLLFGVMDRGEKPFLLAYHPKAVYAGASAEQAELGAKAAPVELVPVVSGSEVKFRFLADGKPVADVEVTIFKPDGGAAKRMTDKDGYTDAFPAEGRYGAWAKNVAARSGEHGGKKYDEARDYATLVADVSAE